MCMWCLGMGLRGEPGSAGFWLDSVVLERQCGFFNVNGCMIDLRQNHRPLQENPEHSKPWIQRLSPSHRGPAPGPLRLVQAASLSPAGLESGMDARLASFAS